MGAYVYNYRPLAGYYWLHFGNPAAVLRFWYVGTLIGRERRFTGGILWAVSVYPDTAVCRVWAASRGGMAVGVGIVVWCR